MTGDQLLVVAIGCQGLSQSPLYIFLEHLTTRSRRRQDPKTVAVASKHFELPDSIQSILPALNDNFSDVIEANEHPQVIGTKNAGLLDTVAVCVPASPAGLLTDLGDR